MSNDLKWNEKGLIPAIVQDADTGEVLMLGYMNAEALRLTLTSGEVWFYSRSRQELWHKGETSGNKIKVKEVWKDCDSDTILVKAHPTGPVCHTGNPTCFFEKVTREDLTIG
ncbi:MAG: phosphoribosyl-AMP cyclohydrolase [Chloroflexi bacterium]|nr:phosphoribosyl-AMP cyclohydrolase [Chloroflexota bacterium]